MAKATGAELLILHVVETGFAWFTGAVYQQIVDQLRDYGTKVLEGATKIAAAQAKSTRGNSLSQALHTRVPKR